MLLKLSRRGRIGQSVAEYAIVMGLVVGAVIAMQTYIKKGLQGRIRDAVDFTDQGGQTANVVQFSGDLFEPDYLKSNFTNNSESEQTESMTTGGGVTRNVTKDTSNRTGTHEIIYNEDTE